MPIGGSGGSLTGSFATIYDSSTDGGNFRGMWFRATGGSVEIRITPLHVAGTTSGSEVIPEDGYVERFCFGGGVRLSDGSVPNGISKIEAKTDDGGAISYGPVMN